MSLTFPCFGEQAVHCDGGWLELDGDTLEKGGNLSLHRQFLKGGNLGEGAITAHMYFGKPDSLGSVVAMKRVKHF